MSSVREILGSGLKVAAATVASLLGWVVASKLLALQFGAAGVGTFGLLRQLLQNLLVLASLNGQTALVQGVAAAQSSEEKSKYAASVLVIQAGLCVFIIGTLLIFAPTLGPLLIAHPEGSSLLRWLAIALVAVVAQSYVYGLLTGNGLLSQLVVAQLAGPLSVLLLVFPMLWLIRNGHASGYVLMLTGPAAAVAVAGGLAACRSRVWPANIRLKVHREHAARFLSTSSALLVTAGIATGVQYLQSWSIAKWLGLEQAGIFWSSWSLSMSYVTLVLGSLGTYYMPKLSQLRSPAERVELMRAYLRLCMTALPLLVATVVVFKPLIIQIMFSASLLPALKVMRWMLIGDLFKGVSWVLAFPMLAFAELRTFVLSELLFWVVLATGCFGWLLAGQNVEGFGAVFLVAYVLYFAGVLYYARSRHGYHVLRREIAHFGGGLALVLLVSVLCWNDTVVRLMPVAAFLCAAATFVCLAEPKFTWKTVWSLASRKRADVDVRVAQEEYR